MTTATLEVRPPQTEAEVTACALLCQRVFQTSRPSFINPSKVNSATAVVLAVFAEDLVIASGRIEATINPKIWYASSIVVDDDTQRTGVGGILLEELEDFAREHGATQIQLWSSVDAISFYESHGYTLVHNPQDAREMYKYL